MISTPFTHSPLGRPEHGIDNPETEPMVYDPTQVDEAFEQLIDSDRADHLLLRTVLAAALATALLALASTLLA